MANFTQQIRRGYTGDWEIYEAQDNHELPREGELVVEFHDNDEPPTLKVGDGKNEFTSLPKIGGSDIPLNKGQGQDSIQTPTSTALSIATQAFGSKTEAGGRGFTIEGQGQLDYNSQGYYVLDSVEGLYDLVYPNGDFDATAQPINPVTTYRYSAVLDTANYNAGNILDVRKSFTLGLDTLNNVVIVDNYRQINPNSNGDDSENFNVYNCFMVVGKPEVGTKQVGFNAYAEGEGTYASNSAAHAEGKDTKALGKFSHAEGNGSIAGHSCHAEGFGTNALGDTSHAEGSSTKALNSNSHAEGHLTTASGHQSHAEGHWTTASGDQSHAEGQFTQAIGHQSHAEGNNTSASGNDSHAEGYGTTASNSSAHAEGYMTTASGSYAHAEGGNSMATGWAAHAEGSSVAEAIYTHAEGYNTTAKGPYAHAEGINTFANGEASHAAGTNTVASQFQYVVGKYNKLIDGPAYKENKVGGALFIVGNGTWDTAETRTNAFRVDTDGKCYAGNSFIGSGADFAEFFEWSDENPSAEDRRGLFVTLEGEKIRLANSEDDYIGIISSTDAFTGNAAFDEWHNKYVTDVFGKIQYEIIEVDEAVDEVTGETIPAHTITQPIINEAYDSTKEYISREHRKEWAIVGLLGQIVIVDDGTCVVGGYAAPSVNGIGTASDKGYRVMKRIDENHVKVFIR